MVWVLWVIIYLAYNRVSDTTILMKDLVVIFANIPCTIWAGVIVGIKIINMYNYGEDCKKWKGKLNMKNNNPYQS